MKILLIDDHSLFREGLRHLLRRLETDAHIFEASSVEAGLALGADEFDLILLDHRLPGLHGLDGLYALRRRFPSSPIILVSGYTESSLADEAIAAGAMGYISKSADVDTMLDAFRRVLNGELCRVDDVSCATVVNPPPASAEAADAAEDGAVHLTRRQQDVLRQLCEGRSNKEIGRHLSMSDNTVRSHVAGIFRALGVKSRIEAVVTARRSRLF